MAGRKKKREKRTLWDLLLTPVDLFCEGISALFVGLFRLLGKALLLPLRGLAFLLRSLLHLLGSASAALVRFFRRSGRRAEQCLRLDGEEFEEYAALLLEDNGFRNVEVTKTSGDQGVDILAELDGVLYAVQCKNYAGAVGNFAVQEAYAGMEYYGCDAAAVLCPGEFTRSARELAESVGVELWDGERLERMMKRSGRKPKHHPKA